MAKCSMKEGRPEKIEGTEFEIEADLIVAAIGQSGVLDGLEEFNNGKNLIDAEISNGSKDYDLEFIRNHVNKLTS